MSATRIVRPSCEFERAYRDLVPLSATRLPDAACSPETPELRDYPLPPDGGPKYALCNGHLTDLFDAQERSARPARVAAAA